MNALALALIRPALIIIENAADVYGGNEIDRKNVTRFVRALLGGLTSECNSTVMLIQHPSVSGLADGTGRSGSTAWNNAGRWRNNFTKIKGDDDGGMLRQFHMVKNNYGPDGELIKLRWERGVFVPVGSIASMAQLAAEASMDDAFMRCLDAATAQGIDVSPKNGRNSAWLVFAKMPEAGTYKERALEIAMHRLLSAGTIKGITVGSSARSKTVLVRAEARS